MTENTAKFVLEIFEARRCDHEATARYMRDVLKIGGIADCRALIREAQDTAYGPNYMAMVRGEDT